MATVMTTVMGKKPTLAKLALKWVSELKGCRETWERIRSATGTARKVATRSERMSTIERARSLKSRLGETVGVGVVNSWAMMASAEGTSFLPKSGVKDSKSSAMLGTDWTLRRVSS